MKKKLLIFLAMLIIALLFMGCVAEELGYIIRDDITFEDLGFAV
jgi:PBP1b-binding outer membrane lipoprotein LpoB